MPNNNSLGWDRSELADGIADAVDDMAVSLRLFRLNWIIVAVVLTVFALGLLLTDFRIRPSGYLVFLWMAGLYGYFGLRNVRSGSRNPRVFSILFMLAQIVLLLLLLTSIGYMAAAANLPMQEAGLLAADRMLGFDFRAYVGFANDRPWVLRAFVFTYDSLHRQLLGLIILLPLLGFHRRAAEFVLAFAMTLIAATIISTLVPAIGAYAAVGLVQADHPNIEPICYYATLHELPLVRDGTTRILDAFNLGPILTFPSFHAICAVLYSWAMWPLRWLRVFGLAWNGVMLAATPVGGGHFFADIVAGIVIALVAIYMVRRLGIYLARSAQPVRPTLLQPVQPAIVGAQ